jgi:hypothetical protein
MLKDMLGGWKGKYSIFYAVDDNNAVSINILVENHDD